MNMPVVQCEMSFEGIFSEFSTHSALVQHYHLHGLDLTIRSQQADILRWFDERLDVFRVPECLVDASITLLFCAIPPGKQSYFNRMTQQWTLLDRYLHIDCYCSGEWFRFHDAERGDMLVNTTQNYGIGSMYLPYLPDALEQVCRQVFLPVLLNMLAAHGLCPLHAAAVAFEDQGIVIAGRSGQGKTTLLLHLLRQGLSYMADDAVFVQYLDGIPALKAYPAAVRVTAETSRFFPEIQDILNHTAAGSGGKFAIDVKKLPQLNIAQSVKPAMLLLPEIAQENTTTLFSISRIEAAMQCVPENTLIGHARTVRAQFGALCQLIQHMRCYRVRMGKNMENVGQQVVDLISSVNVARN